GVQGPAIEEADDRTLEHHPDDADDDGCEQDSHPHGEAVRGGDENRIGAEHQKLALGQVQDAHHPEDDGKAQGEKHQSGDGEEDADDSDRYLIHAAPPFRLVDPTTAITGVRTSACIVYADPASRSGRTPASYPWARRS